MLVSEMHIGIDLGLQVLNSSITKNISKEEKDWFLNNEVIKFINQRLNPQSNSKNTGFQDTTKRIKDLKDLYKSKSLIVKTDENGRSYVDFPFNCFEYIKFDSNSIYACNRTKSKTKSTEYSVNFNLDLLTADNNYVITITKDTVTHTLFALEELPDGYISLSELDKYEFMFLQAIQIKLTKKLQEIFNNVEVKFNESLTCTIKSEEEFTNLSVNTVNYTIKEIEVQKYDKSYTPLISNIRVIDSEFFRDVANSSLSKATVESFIGEVIDNRLYIEYPNSVVIGSVNIGYICNPNAINIYLNSNLNMANSICKEIVSNTIRFLKALVKSGNYQEFVRENILIE